MKFDSVRFVKDQALQCEEMVEIELSSAELETICGGGSCPGSNGFSYNGNPYQGYGYNYGGSSCQGYGSNYGGSPNYGGYPNYGYGSGCNQAPPCMVPPNSCSYSY